MWTWVWLLSLTLVRSSYPRISTVQIALIADRSNELTVSMPEFSLVPLNHSGNEVMFNVHHFGELDTFLNETGTECPFTAVVALVSCAANAHLYEHLRHRCSGAMLFTLFESTCPRPPSDIGVGIAHLNSVGQLTALLADVGLALAQRWPSVTVMHQTELDLLQLTQLVSLFKSLSEQSQVQVFRLSNESVSTRTLSSFNLQVLATHKMDNRKRLFVVIANRLMLEKIILTSKQLGLINHANKWIFVLTQRSSIELLSEQVKDIASQSDILIMHSVRDQDCSALKLDCILDLVQDTIRKAIYKVISDSNYDFENHKRKIKNRLLSETKILLGPKDGAELQCGNCDHYRVESLVKHRTNDIVDPRKGIVQVNRDDIQFELVTQSEGIWSPFKGLLLKNDQDSETNLKNRPLNIGIVDQPPMIRIYKNGIHGNSTQQIVGTTYEMVLVLAAKLNFTPSFVVDYSLNLGYLQPNGSWTGMLKRVIDGEVDIGANGYWKTYDRLKAVYFTFPFNLKEVGMLVKKTEEDHNYLFLAPFTWDAWLSILATVMGMGPLLWLVHRSSKYYEYYRMQDNKGLFKMSNCVWYCFGAMVQQGGDYLPMAISGRILITFWWLFVIVTVTTYSGNLVALLTFPKIFNPINDLYDLIKYKNVLKYGATRTSGIEEVIKDSANTALQMLLDNIVYYDSVDVDNLFEQVKHMRMVFLATDTEIRYLISEDFRKYNSCQLMIAKEPILTKSVSFVMGNDKPLRFKEKVDYEVGRMAKSGLVTLWNKKYEVKGNDCLFPLLVRAGDVKKIELSHMVDCFFVLALGVLLAIICLSVEIAKRRKHIKVEQKKGLSRMANLVSIGKLWHKLSQAYRTVMEGRLYSNWLDRDRSQPGLVHFNASHSNQPNYSNQARELYHNYMRYNANRANQADWGSYLQRNLRSNYWQNGLSRTGTWANQHTRHPHWNYPNRPN